MKQQGTHLEFQISHMLPAFLAEAQNIGGNRLMFLTVPILGGAALLAFYLLACRLLRQPVAALGATATLAFLMPQVSFSRDSTTEIPIQLLLFTALWLLCDRRTLRKPALRVRRRAAPRSRAGDARRRPRLPRRACPRCSRSRGCTRTAAGRDRLAVGIVWASSGVRGRSRCSRALDLLRWDRSYLSVVRGNVERLAAVEIVAIAAAIVRRRARAATRRLDAIQRMRGGWPTARARSC